MGAVMRYPKMLQCMSLFSQESLHRHLGEELIDQLLAGDDTDQQENEGGFGCGPDGCNFPGGAEDAAPSGCGPDGCR